jgi:hypothetical protein
MDESRDNGFLTSLQGVYPPNYHSGSNELNYSGSNGVNPQYQAYPVSGPEVPSIEYFRPAAPGTSGSILDPNSNSNPNPNPNPNPVMHPTHDQSLSSLLQNKDYYATQDANYYNTKDTNYYNATAASATTGYYHPGGPVGPYANQHTVQENSWNYNNGYYDSAWNYYENYDYYYNTTSYDYNISYNDYEGNTAPGAAYGHNNYNGQEVTTIVD